MSNFYPDPKQLQTTKPWVHVRDRIVIQQPCEADAIALAERLSETLSVDHEQFVALVDGETGELRGEVVVARTFHQCKGATAPTPESADLTQV